MRRPISTLLALLALTSGAHPANADEAQPQAPRERLEETARAYLSVWAIDGRAACEERRPACEGMDAVLDRAARALAAAGKRGEAIAAWRALTDPRYHLEQTERARTALHDIGAAYQAMAAFEEAAASWERFAREAPARDEAPAALADAALLRLRLGQVDLASADAERFRQSFPAAAHLARSVELTFALAAHHEDRGDPEAARAVLAEAMPRIDRGAPRDVQISAHGRLGRVLARLGRTRAAAAEHGRVQAAARRSGRWAKRPAAAPPWSEGALEAAAEAFFFSAEQKREAAARIQLRPYQGAGDRGSVTAYLTTTAADWLERKRAAVEAAERAYLRVFGADVPEPPPPPPPPPPGVIGLLGGDPSAPLYPSEGDLLSSGDPPPSPRLAIAAAARVGALWDEVMRSVRSMPVVPFPSDEIRATYYSMVCDGPADLARERAKAAFEACLRLSVRYRLWGEDARACEGWLARNYGAEYKGVEEIVPAPAWGSAGVVGRPAPLPVERLAAPARAGRCG
jgi:tetratricopeptide (TPR) repeat protein